MFDAFISARLFSSIRGYIVDLIHQFGYAGMARAYGLAVAVGTVMLTIWFMWQGYRIATGQSRDSMQAMLMRAVTVITMLSLAQGMALFGQELSTFIVDDLRNSIARVITGNDYHDPADMISRAITQMLVLQTALDVYQANGASTTSNLQMANFLNFSTGLSQSMPALIAGGLMLLNEIALHLCLVVAPLCILAYIYEPTRFLFVNWLKFTIATLFSMVIISVVTVIALRAIIVLIAALLAMDVGNGIANALGVNASLQLRDIATLSGGVGMLLTMLLLSAPGLIYNFFSGGVGAQVHGYNAFGGMSPKINDRVTLPMSSLKDGGWISSGGVQDGSKQTRKW